MNPSGQLLAEYTWGPLGPLMMRRYHPANQTWTTSYYGMDGQGHTRLLLSGTGAVQAVYTYDAWGNRVRPGANSASRVKPENEYVYIPLTGLYHVGAREYDPRTARWLQRDPIDAASGDPNLYRYCGNDPVNLVDPNGLDWLQKTSDFFAGWGDALTTLPDWLGGDSVTQHLRRALGVDEVVYPCSEAYRWGDRFGSVHDLLLTRGRGKASRNALSKGSGSRSGFHSLDDFGRAAQQPDRGGFTKAGRGLSKHGNRPGSAYPKAKGNPKQVNAQAQEIVEDILTDPTSVRTLRYHARFGWIIEIKNASGRGLRYDINGTFLGFLN